MKKTMKQLVFLTFYFCSGFINAQNNFYQFNNIKATAQNPDFTKTAVATDKFIYILDNKLFKVLDSISVANYPNYSISAINFNHNDLIVAKYGEQNMYDPQLINPRFQFEENLLDSIIIYSISTKEVKSRLPGNSYVTLNSDKIFLAAFNNYFEWKDNYGNSHLGTQSGELLMFNGDQKLQAYANGSVKSLCISPNKEFVAFLYYLNDSVKIETRSALDLSIVNIQQFSGELDLIKFSDDNQYIVGISTDNLGDQEEIRVFSSEQLKELALNDFPNDLLLNRIEKGTIWTLEDNSILQKDFRTNKRITEIWANLTPFTSIKSFYKISEDEILISGKGNFADPNEKNTEGIYRFSLKQNKLYSDFSRISKDIDTIQFFDPAQLVFQNNELLEGKTQFCKDGSIMMIHNEKQLQLWDTKKRMKLYDFAFDNTINPYINENGKEILIFMKYEGKTFSDFYLQKLNLTNGKLISKLFEDNPYPFISPIDGSNFCLPSQGADNNWNYFEWLSDFVWEIDLDSMNIKNGIQFIVDEDKDYSEVNRVYKIPDSDNFLLQIDRGKTINESVFDKELDPEKSGFYLLKSTEGSISKLNGLNDIPNLFPVSKNKCIGVSKNSKEIIWYDLINQKTTLLKKLDPAPDEKKLNDFVFPRNERVAYFVRDNPSSNGDLLVDVIDLKAENWERSFTLSEQVLSGVTLFGDYFLLSKPNYFNDFLLKSLNPETQQSLLWDVKKIEGRFNNVQIDSNLILFQKQSLIDLSEFSIRKVNAQTFQLLKQQNVLVDISSNPYGSEYKNEFWLEAYAISNLDTAKWVSNHVKYKDLESSLLTELLVSSNENYGMFGVNTMFGYKDKICIANLNAHTLEIRSLPYKISSWGVFDDDTYWVIKARDIDYSTIDTNVKSEYFDFKTGKKIEDQLIEEKLKKLNNPTINFQNVNYQNQQYYSREYLSQVLFVPQRNRLVACGNKLHFWEVGNSTPIKQMQLSSAYIDQIVLEGNLLYASARDGAIYVVDIEKMEVKIILKSVIKDNISYMAAFTPEGYFKAPKQVMKDFHFVKDGKIFPLSNYELFLNRPDLILSRLGYSDEITISIYKEAYLKRLKRNGFTENTDFFSLEMPTVQLKNSINEVTTDPNVKLELSFSENAESFSVYDNGVSVATHKIDQTHNAKVSIDLHQGENNISIIARSKGGIESDPEFLRVDNTSASYTPKIYYVGIGVSKYKDTLWNLNYADADVTSLSKFFQNKNYFSSPIEVDSLLNEQATKMNYLSLKNKLMKTNVNDIVIISLSGHGILDAQNDFYFATHDIDFGQPEDMGLSYQDVLSVLDEIPARKKLLLLDACHSGEADEDTKKDWITVNDSPAKDGNKGGKTENTNAENLLSEKSFEIMKNTFQELDRGTGTFVISASGAKEFAVENGGNGIFTLSVINAMADWHWDNKGQMTISQLQKEVYERVFKLSGGRQKPMSRAENTEWDWVIE